jgi:hypothetical protein
MRSPQLSSQRDLSRAGPIETHNATFTQPRWSIRRQKVFRDGAIKSEVGKPLQRLHVMLECRFRIPPSVLDAQSSIRVRKSGRAFLEQQDQTVQSTTDCWRGLPVVSRHARIRPSLAFMGATGATAPPTGRTPPGCHRRRACGVVAVSLACGSTRLTDTR